VAIAFAYFGALLVRHPGRYLLGSGKDPQIFVWSFAWWPHAILTWQNPFVSKAIYAPTGINLAWVTSVPGLAIVFAPVTVLFGPDVSYNLAQMLMPALAAWTAFLLCRHLTRSTWASAVGGYLFGFSSYMLGQELGHLHLTSVFLLPLLALATIRYVEGELDGRGAAIRLGVLFGLQFWISSEVCVTAALMLAFGLAVAYATVPGARSRLRSLLRPLAAAVGISAIVAGPLLAYAITGFQSGSIFEPATADGDALNLVVPTRLIAFGGSSFAHASGKLYSDLADQGLYLGLPSLLIVALYLIGGRRSPVVRFAVAALAVAVVLDFGTDLYVGGHREFLLPWKAVAKLPVLDNVLTVRLSVYVALAGSAIVALWTAGRRSWPGQLVLPGLAVLALVPAVWHHDFREHPERWAFFTHAQYKCFPKNDNIAIFPFGVLDNSTLWQAESDFWFRMPDGYLTPTPPAASMLDPLIRNVTFTDRDPTILEILAMAKHEKVDRIVSIAPYAHPNGTQMHRFGALGNFEGVYLAPTCGYPSLQTGVHPTPPHPPKP
jgi:hypothetical protein